jgi:hypothetical protein
MGYDYIHSVYFVGNGLDADWMGRMVRDKGQWRFEYRFRYYKDDKAFDSKDVKNWYAFAAKEPGDEGAINLLEGLKKIMLPLLEVKFRSKMDVVMLECSTSDPKVLFELGSRPWANVKRLSKEEFEGLSDERKT